MGKLRVTSFVVTCMTIDQNRALIVQSVNSDYIPATYQCDDILSLKIVQLPYYINNINVSLRLTLSI